MRLGCIYGLGAICVAWTCAMASSGCNEGPHDPPRALCDGSSGVRLAYQVVVDPSRVTRGESVMYDNGAWFLFVDGQCRYYVQSTDSFSGEVHAGSLSEAEARQLAAELRFDAWPRLAGVYGSGDVNDASPLLFHDGVNAILCLKACLSGVPDEVTAMRDHVDDWIQRLWTDGLPVASGLRIQVVEFGDMEVLPEDLEASDWPLSTPVQDFAVSIDDPRLGRLGAGRALDDLEDARKLRLLRDDYRRGAHGSSSYNYLPVRDPSGVHRGYRAYVRDRVEWENDAGIVVAPVIP